VEVSASVADLVIERVTGSTIRGRRAVARRDEGGRREPAGGKREGFGAKRDAGRGAREGGRDRGAPRPPRREASRDPLAASRKREPE